MAKTEIKFEINLGLKQAAEAVFKENGITPEEAITKFYEEVRKANKLPFRETLPNDKITARLDDSWQKWVDENLARNCAPEEIKQILLQNNFSLSAIRRAMGDSYPAVQGEEELKKNGVDYEALSNIRITKAESGAVRFVTNKVQLYTLDNFLSPEECEKLITLTDKGLRPSTITTEHSDKYFRTSSSCDLVETNNDFVKEINQRICKTIGINCTHAEGMQAQKYKVGQEFKAHVDYFEPNSAAYEKYAGKMGNRTWTFMIYLNDTPKGGGTGFINLNKIFYPKKGSALIWNNLYDDGTHNADTLHSGMPVEEGEKYVITKWFREKGSGPMFLA